MRRAAYIGLGANQGDPVETFRAALESLQSLEQSHLTAVSRYFASAPIDAPGPDYVNAVARLETNLEPYGLLLHLLDMEVMLGRKRRGGNARRNAPRSVDLDLLLVDDLIIQSVPLTLPHPRMHQRAFVLMPLVDLDPDIRIPGRGMAGQLLAALPGQRVELLAMP